MNPKIRELADQAKMSTYLLAYGIEFNIAIEQFAELILKECAKIVVDCDVTEYSDFRQGIAQEIKKHFGVANAVHC